MRVMPHPVTVWKVDLVRGKPPVEVRGTLTLAAGALVFQADGTAATTTIALADASGVKRLRGSPVLVISHAARDAGATAFYFAEPPPLHPADPATLSLRDAGPPSPMAAMRRPSPRRHRRQNAGYLAGQGRMLKPTLNAWASEVRAGIEAARGGRD
jgi:hypothetical protein